MTGLFDILACPTCRVKVVRQDDHLLCSTCNTRFPIIDNVPIMFPDGRLAEIEHQENLNVLNSYNPWVPRLMLQSLLDDQIVLEVGAGNMALDDPCIIRMDVMLSPYVDIVADAHALPFLPGSLDFIFSLAVFEHLRNPFQAAQSMYEVLKDGGYVYHECNFIFGYHAFPHHYFNATMQGMEQVFQAYIPLRQGVAPYQMPSFAVKHVLGTYLQYSHAAEHEDGQSIIAQFHQVINSRLGRMDMYFSEEEALKIAAGTYFAGMKQITPSSTLIKQEIVNIWREKAGVSRRFPNINNITTADNILLWAKQEGKADYPEIEDCLNEIVVFNKRGPAADWDRSAMRSFPVINPLFGGIDSATGELPADENSPTRGNSLSAISRRTKQGIEVLTKEGPIQFTKGLLRYIERKL